MKEASLITEFIILGIIASASLLFSTLTILGIHDLTFILELKEYKEITYTLAIAVFYFLGAIFHRIGNAFIPFLTKIGGSVPLLKKYSAYMSCIPMLKKKNLYLRQYASTQITDYIDYLRRQLLLFRSLFVLLILFGLSLSIWLFSSNQPTKYVVVAFCLPVSLALLALLAYKHQTDTYEATINNAYEILEKEKKD